MERKRRRRSGARELDGNEYGEENASSGSLSDDSLVQVLRELPTRYLMSYGVLVCRRWLRLIRSYLVLELVPPIISPCGRIWGSLTDRRFLRLAKDHASTIQKLELGGFEKLTTDDVVSLISSLPHLRDLSITRCPLLNLEEIGKCLPSQLEKLHLCASYICFRSPAEISGDSFLTTLQNRCPTLRTLHLDFCNDFEMRGLESLFRSCCTLTSLDLHSHTIGWSEVETIFRCCRSIRSVSVVSPFLAESESSNNARGQALHGRLSRLRSAHQSPLPKFTFPPSIVSIRLYSSLSQSVPLSSHPGLGLLAQIGHQLQHLHGQRLFNTSWHTISVWCGNLKILDLSHAKGKFQGLSEVEEVVLCGAPRLLKKLEKVALPTATDRVLREFGRFCPMLQEFRFQGHGSGTTSQTLITDRGVMGLAEGCSRLEVLSLEGCSKITISSTRSLAFHCANLKSLHLRGCKLVDDKAIAHYLSRAAHSLRLLDVVGCPKISLATLKFIHELCEEHAISLRILWIQPSLWKASRAWIADFKQVSAHTHVICGYSDYLWCGFYDSRSLSEL